MRRNYDELRVNHQLDTPLSVQLATKLGRAIRAGWWGVDEALPSERMLSGWLKLSRVTTRRAYDMLVQEGLIYRRRGSGSYVKQIYEQPLAQLLGFSEVFRARGMSPHSNWLSKKEDHPTTEEALALGLEADDWVVRLKRQRLVEHKPIAYEVSTLPIWAAQNPDLITQSLYDYLDQTPFSVVRGRQHILAMNATAEVAKYCCIRVGQAVLQVARTGYTADERIVEYSVTYCRSDYYDFTVELNRSIQEHELPSRLSLSHTR